MKKRGFEIVKGYENKNINIVVKNYYKYYVLWGNENENRKKKCRRINRKRIFSPV